MSQLNNNQQNQNGEEPLEEQGRRVICSLPISPSVFGGSYIFNDEYSTDSPTSMVSELSFSPDTSEGTLYAEVHTNAVPIVEFPSEEDARRNRLSSQDQVITPQMIGAALKKSGTVLMQRSRDNRLARQLEEMRDLMRNEDELVVLKEPSVSQMASQPAFPRDAMEEFLEHSETMFNLVHDANVQMAGRADSIERISRHSSEEVLPIDNRVSKEFVGCFSRNDDTVLYKRTIAVAQEAQPSHDPARQSLENIDTVIAQHAQCLHEAETVMEPSVHIYQRNDDNLLALLTFSKDSSAVLKTSNAMLKEAPIADLDKTIRQTYRKIVANPDEMISMQTEVASSSDYQAMKETSPRHTQRLGEDSQQTFSTRPSSFGLTNESNNLSGDLEKQQTEVYTTVSGSISDQHGNLAVQFDAQAGSLDKEEPTEECVIRVERLSDEFDLLSESLTFQVIGDEAENVSDTFVVATVIEELTTDERLLKTEQLSGTIVLSETILERLGRCLKGLLEPVAIMVYNIYKKLEGIDYLRSGSTKIVSVSHFSSSSQENSVVESRKDEGSELLKNDAQSRSFTNFCALENLQEIRSIFGETNDHLTVIQSDVSAIKTKMNFLIEEQNQKVKQSPPSTDIQHVLQRPSNRETQQLGNMKDKVVTQTVCLALLANHFLSNGLYCPVEIYSCHAVSPEAMVVHWTVDQDLLSCIIGFEIFVDGVLSSVCFSNRRRTALLGNIDLQKQHHITLHATPDQLTREAKVEWAPAFFLYHLLDESVH